MRITNPLRAIITTLLALLASALLMGPAVATPPHKIPLRAPVTHVIPLPKTQTTHVYLARGQRDWVRKGQKARLVCDKQRYEMEITAVYPTRSTGRINTLLPKDPSCKVAIIQRH